MCGLKAAQIRERPFGAAKVRVQPKAALDSFALRQKDFHLTPFIIPATATAATTAAAAARDQPGPTSVRVR